MCISSSLRPVQRYSSFRKNIYKGVQIGKKNIKIGQRSVDNLSPDITINRLSMRYLHGWILWSKTSQTNM